MGRLSYFDHAVIRVLDVDTAVAWYRDVLGFKEVDRREGIAYLACGGNAHMDLGLRPGGTGLDHAAFAVPDGQALEALALDLRAAGVSFSRIPAGSEPGVRDGLRFAIPSGHMLEAAVKESGNGYLHLGEWDAAAAHAPLDANHVTIMTPRVREVSAFLRERLGFLMSDLVQPEPELWAFAFLRVGENHHDFAVALSPAESTLHHIAFQTRSLDDVGRFADLLLRRGHRAETAIVRHGPGGNASLYVRDPSGNRVELTTDLARVPDPSQPPRIWPCDLRGIYNVWTLEPVPETFAHGT